MNNVLINVIVYIFCLQVEPFVLENFSSMADEDKENNKNPPPSKSDNYDGWGFDLFPERRGTFKPTVKNILLQGRGRETTERIRCENRVNHCLNKSAYSLIFYVYYIGINRRQFYI